jgi:hypothetical protein
MVDGYCDERFIEAKKIFEESIDSGFELGCAITMEVKGEVAFGRQCLARHANRYSICTVLGALRRTRPNT